MEVKEYTIKELIDHKEAHVGRMTNCKYWEINENYYQMEKQILGYLKLILLNGG